MDEKTITPFKYNNGVNGLMYSNGKREFNLTVNLMDTNQYRHGLLMKYYGEPEHISRALVENMVKRGLWKKVKVVSIGINWAQFVTVIKQDEKK